MPTTDKGNFYEILTCFILDHLVIPQIILHYVCFDMFQGLLFSVSGIMETNYWNISRCYKRHTTTRINSLRMEFISWAASIEVTYSYHLYFMYDDMSLVCIIV